MNSEKIAVFITAWLKDYSNRSKTSGFVVGISGGIDSAVTSTLCAETGKKVICVNMPIHQKKDEYERGNEHIEWLMKKYPGVSKTETQLTDTFETMRKAFPADVAQHWLSMANTRARLRMATLYAIAQTHSLLVAGTGNKVEDFGVGFFTKYGDGGVDLSPIADITKTQVFELGNYFGITSKIQNAKPTDGLWEDGRSDEDQIGATYPELEWAMNHIEALKTENEQLLLQDLTERQKEVIKIYFRFHNANLHKMVAIPVCKIPKEFF
ncbi:MAG: NAD(+) synthase [Bacteroidota bacterium]